MGVDHVLTSAGRKLFAKHIDQYTPVDPLYEYYTDDRGRKKRRKVTIICLTVYQKSSCFDSVTPLQREVPSGLSSRDVKILLSVKRRAHRLDKGFHLCGMRFGWTFFIGE